MPVELYSAFAPPPSLEKMEHDRQLYHHHHQAAAATDANKHSILPGPSKGDKHYYGPLEMPPKVDAPMNTSNRDLTVEEPKKKKHPEFGGCPSKKGEKLIPGPPVTDTEHFCAFSPPPAKIVDVSITEAGPIKHPEYGSSSREGKEKFSPFDLPPKVDVPIPESSVEERRSNSKKHPEFGGCPSKKGEKLIPGPAVKDTTHFCAFSPPPAKIADAPKAGPTKHPEYGSSQKTDTEKFSPFDLPPKVDVTLETTEDATKHPEYGGCPYKEAERLTVGEKDRSNVHWSAFEPCPSIDLPVDRTTHSPYKGTPKPQYAAAPKKGRSGVKYGPCNQAPSVDIDKEFGVELEI